MNKILRYLIAILGINLVIFIHEFGHFITCKIFGVTTPVFSIGFGPQLIGFNIGQTHFQLAMLPIGGYVSMAEGELAAQPFLHQAIIILAGIVFNLIFGFVILLYLKRTGKLHELMPQPPTQQGRRVAGPIGIIHMISQSLHYGPHFFWRILAILSINIGIFNLFPIPFFDGGQLLAYTLKAMHAGSDDFLRTIYIIFFALVTLFFLYLIVRNILRRK